MKRRLLPAISIGIAVILIGSLAYAADRRKSSKSVDRPADPTHEEEALKAELLDAVDRQEKKPQDPDAAGKVAAIKAVDDKSAEHAAVTKQKQ